MNETALKRTILYGEHAALGAKLVALLPAMKCPCNTRQAFSPSITGQNQRSPLMSPIWGRPFQA